MTRWLGPGLLVGLAVALVAAAVLGQTNPGGFVLLARSSGSFFVLTTAALVALGAAQVWSVHSPMRVTGIVLISIALLVWLGVAWLWSPFVGEGVVDAAADAPGAGTHYRAVVRDDTGAIVDPVLVLSVEQTDSPLARAWPVGCMTEDSGVGDFAGLRWRDSTHLLVSLGGRRVAVTVDARTGRPRHPPASLGVTC